MSLCLRYLAFPCFQHDKNAIDTAELEQSALEGHLAFQDYAVAKWFHHVNAFVDAGKALLERESETYHGTREGRTSRRPLEEISIALEDFIMQYDEEDWHNPKNIVNECIENCKVFKDRDFYENLVAITSHIYKFQKKGFEARHKVSIKALASALERNRKVLQDLPPRLTPDQMETFRQFYDDERKFKCSNITCIYFSKGFKDSKTQKKHENIHERPFQCEVENCHGAELGFTNSKDLEK